MEMCNLETIYSRCPKTGRPVWRTGHKNVRISARPVIGHSDLGIPLYVLLFFLKVAIPVGWFLSILFPSYTFPYILSGVQALQTTELQQFKYLDVLPRSSES